MPAVSNPRILVATGVVLAALIAVVVAAGGSGDGETAGKPVRAKLTLERAVQPEAGNVELVVSLPDRRLNSPDTTGGATSVLLRCADRNGRVTIRQRHKWPLVEETGYPPHIHQPAVPEVLDGLRSCRITGPGVAFAGRVAGRLPTLRPVQ